MSTFTFLGIYFFIGKSSKYELFSTFFLFVFVGMVCNAIFFRNLITKNKMPRLKCVGVYFSVFVWSNNLEKKVLDDKYTWSACEIKKKDGRGKGVRIRLEDGKGDGTERGGRGFGGRGNWQG